MRTSGRETGGKNEEEIDRGNGQDRQIREQRDRERGEREMESMYAENSLNII